MDQKEYLLNRIEKLMELIKEVFDMDEKKKKFQLFPDFFLEIQSIEDNLKNKNILTKESLVQLNYYYRESMMNKKLLEENKEMTHQEFLEWKIKDIIENDDETNRFQKATYFTLENVVQENGDPYSIQKASDFVEQIREKYGIKKDKVNLYLKNYYPNTKIQTIKAIRMITNMGLKDAKNFTEKLITKNSWPALIKTNVDVSEANKLFIRIYKEVNIEIEIK